MHYVGKVSVVQKTIIEVKSYYHNNTCKINGLPDSNQHQ